MRTHFTFLSLFLLALLSFLAGWMVCSMVWKQEAVERGYGEFGIKNGLFRWIEVKD